MTDLQAIADRVEIAALRGEFTDAAMMRDRTRDRSDPRARPHWARMRKAMDSESASSACSAGPSASAGTTTGSGSQSPTYVSRRTRADLR